jgi:hypothetical protein
MTVSSTYWDIWAPYLPYLEDNLLDLETITELSASVTDPVLVVGAGQGLLVQGLTQKGFRVDGVERSPVMIEYARSRRGLKLIEADARNMPFDDNTYATSIIATGVVDFMDDEQLVKEIVDETKRVTTDTGKVFVAFFGVHPATEKFLRTIGLIANGRLYQRRVLQLSRLRPIAALAAIRKEADLSFLRAIQAVLTMQIGLPSKEKRIAKMWAKIFKEADNPDLLIRAAAESLPFRTELDIRDLFRRLDIQVRNLQVFGSCTVAQL